MCMYAQGEFLLVVSQPPRLNFVTSILLLSENMYSLKTNPMKCLSLIKSIKDFVSDLKFDLMLSREEGSSLR